MMEATTMIVYFYIAYITDPYRSNYTKIIFGVPFLINVIILGLNITDLQIIKTEHSNYTSGVSVLTCYAVSCIYVFITFINLFRQWKYIEYRRRLNVLTYLCAFTIVPIFQTVFPSVSITGFVPLVVVLGAYLNQESPESKELELYHSTMVVNFADLVESRDESTGGHIKRTTEYVRVLVKALQKRHLYRRTLTKDFVNNLLQAAPMHDIGKIGIPDGILLKEGRFSNDEYDIMKTHSEIGSAIIESAFGKLDLDSYVEIASDVAGHHHEKWNGKGYPSGLQGEEIPLGARIMAIADVFDAVSQKRCYKDAFPLEDCFEIIKKGRGIDFDPILVDVFLSIKSDVKKVFESM